MVIDDLAILVAAIVVIVITEPVKANNYKYITAEKCQGWIDSTLYESAPNNTDEQVNDNTSVGQNGIYKGADYHGREDNDVKSKAPKDGQAALDNSVPLNPDTTKRRIGISDGEIVVLDETSEGIFHGHVRNWDSLSDKMRSVLRREGMVNKKGKIK